MLGILIIAHGNLGHSLLECAKHVLGELPERVAAIEVYMFDNEATMISRLWPAVEAIDSGDGVLILSDIFGATPCNIAARLMERGKVEAISGVNVPMVLRLPLQMAVAKVMHGAREGIIRLSTDQCYGEEA
ncbi:MAG: PTS fructose transporter subunit IIA [Betaproteobacteria bacterium]|nr:PTS fructose transporter subunit IIA [Betaproteobacteria bacterium]